MSSDYLNAILSEFTTGKILNRWFQRNLKVEPMRNEHTTVP